MPVKENEATKKRSLYTSAPQMTSLIVPSLRSISFTSDARQGHFKVWSQCCGMVSLNKYEKNLDLKLPVGVVKLCHFREYCLDNSDTSDVEDCNGLQSKCNHSKSLFFQKEDAATKFFLIKIAFCSITLLHAMKNLVVRHMSHTPYTVTGKLTFPNVQCPRFTKRHMSMKTWVGPRALM